MTRNSRNRLTTVLFALVSLLFMQLALAGYTCAASSPRTAEAAAMADSGMPCAESMSFDSGEQQPGLCHAHCQAQQQSADRHALPFPIAIHDLPASFGLQLVVPTLAKAPLQAPLLLRTMAPPFAIVNCCFRL